MIFNKLNHLQQRIIGGGVAALAALILILLSQAPAFKPITVALIAGIIGASMWECLQIAYAKNLQPAGKLCIGAGVLYALAVALNTQYAQFNCLPEIVLLGSLLSFFIYYFVKGQSPFLNLASSVFCFAYLAVPLSCIISITYFFSQSGAQDGRWWIAYLLGVTKMTDTAAFIIGRKFGRQKLAPYISPNKSWEGALGGFCVAIGMSVVMTLAAKIAGADFSLTLWQSVWLGAGIAILAELGDLAESLLKRDGGIKDSNRLPGLGGILDIVDSLVFTAPLVYIFLKSQ